MFSRFLKLLYFLAIISIVLYFPIFLILEIDVDRISTSYYYAKCKSNGQYVVLQGSPSKQNYHIYDEVTLENNLFGDTKKEINFYCKHYDEIQPHVTAYIDSETVTEEKSANNAFFEFRESVFSGVSSYPLLYDLELVREEFHPYRIYEPIIAGLVGVVALFLFLQFSKIQRLVVHYSFIELNSLFLLCK